MDDIYTALCEAEDNHDQVLKNLLDEGADINAVDDDGNTALIMLAINEGVNDAFKALLKAGADTTIENDDCKDALSVFIDDYDHKTVLDLLENGMIQIGTKGNLHPALRKCPCLCKHPLVLKWVQENNIPEDMASCTDHEAISTTNEAFKCMKWVAGCGKHAMRGCCSYVRDDEGRTVMMDVCSSGYIQSVSLVHQFIDEDLCPRDMVGRTDMHHAVIGGSPEVVQYLVDNKFTMDVEDDNGQTPLDLARELHSTSAQDPRNNVRKPKPQFPTVIPDSQFTAMNIVNAIMKANAAEKSGVVMEYVARATTDDYAKVIKILEKAEKKKATVTAEE
jgi:hypothetical protein